MKRLHVNVAVEDLDRSIAFYASLFAAEPTVRKPDYAKWMLEDPRVNFSISTRGALKGVDHLGIQVEELDELRAVQARLDDAGAERLDEGETTCCYARSNKSWVRDPQGVAWETFLTLGDSPIYGRDPELEAPAPASSCCVPKIAEAGCC